MAETIGPLVVAAFIVAFIAYFVWAFVSDRQQLKEDVAAARRYAQGIQAEFDADMKIAEQRRTERDREYNAMFAPSMEQLARRNLHRQRLGLPPITV